MKRNFEFEVITVVRWGERFIDLHNAYDIDGFGTDLGGSEVRLSFVRNEYALDLELPSKVALVCSGNVKIAFNDLGLLAAPLNDEGIQIAYFNDACDWLSLLDEDTARSHPPQGLHVDFINGLAVRIFCDEAALTTL
jgi:hypothetical protein